MTSKFRKQSVPPLKLFSYFPNASIRPLQCSSAVGFVSLSHAGCSPRNENVGLILASIVSSLCLTSEKCHETGSVRRTPWIAFFGLAPAEPFVSDRYDEVPGRWIRQIIQRNRSEGSKQPHESAREP